MKDIVTTVILSFLLAHGAFGQGEDVIELQSKSVTATRLADEPFGQPYAFYRATIDDLDDGIGRTPLDRMNYGPGVFVQRTAPAQASPFIRGLTGEQTLLMFDGIRFSHAFMRPGPNQYAATIPSYSLESIDVILGSGSTMQGSNGLTGAMDFRLAPAGRGVETAASGWSGTRVDSGNGYQLFGGIDGVTDNWAYSLEMGVSDFHDRVGGSDFRDNIFVPARDDEIRNTGYEDFSFGLRLAYMGSEDRLTRINAGHTRQTDAPRPDGYFGNSGRSDRFYRYYDPQAFSYAHLTDSWNVNGGFIDRLETKLWWHGISEEQFRRRTRSGNTVLRDEVRDDSLDALGIDVQAISLEGAQEQHELTWGFTYIHETTDNQYERYQTPAGSLDPADLAPSGDWVANTTIPNGSSYKTLGLFGQDRWQVSESFNLLAGLRYSRYDWKFGLVDGDVDDLTGNLRGIWNLDTNQRLFAGASRGFRAPNLVNLAGSGVDRGSSGLPATGNADLDPELSWTFEIGWKWVDDLNYVSLSVFDTGIDHFIQQDTTDTVVNTDRADLNGFEVAWDYGWNVGNAQRWSLTGAMSMVDDATIQEPIAGGGFVKDNISRANRLYGNLGVKYKHSANWWGMLQTRWHDAYDDVASTDAGDVRLTIPGNPDGSLPGYGIINLILGWKGDDGKRSVNLFVENIGDKTYREPGSGADGVGRNFGMAAHVRY